MEVALANGSNSRKHILGILWILHVIRIGLDAILERHVCLLEGIGILGIQGPVLIDVDVDHGAIQPSLSLVFRLHAKETGVFDALLNGFGSLFVLTVLVVVVSVGTVHLLSHHEVC